MNTILASVALGVIIWTGMTAGMLLSAHLQRRAIDEGNIRLHTLGPICGAVVYFVGEFVGLHFFATESNLVVAILLVASSLYLLHRNITGNRYSEARNFAILHEGDEHWTEAWANRDAGADQ